MNTQIKRLYQNNSEFVPITVSEAVVVNTIGIAGLSDLEITTLDKVLSRILGLTELNDSSISTINNLINQINNVLSNKQDKLTPGTGITIDENGVISASASTNLYTVVTSLESITNPNNNTIYLVPSSSVSGNIYKEFIYVTTDSGSDFEEIGEVKTSIDLSGYVTTQTFNTKIASIEGSMLTAQNITNSSGVQIYVDYSIPTDLYDEI